MHIRLVFAALALLSFSFPAPVAVAATGVVLDAGCNTLGATAMADDHTSILLCAFPSPNPATTCGSPSGCKWKAMSGGSGASCPAQSVLIGADYEGLPAAPDKQVIMTVPTAAGTHGSFTSSQWQCQNGTWVFIMIPFAPPVYTPTS